jgi:Protein of unknown function (DUF998)
MLIFSGLGGVLFATTFTLLGFVAPGYSQMRDAISSLELTSIGLAQQANFLVFGLLQCAFALALRRELENGFGASLIPLFQALGGLGVIGDAIFVHPPLHLACDLVAFNSALLVLLLFAWRLRGDKRWRGWTTYSVASAVAMMAFLFLFGWLNVHGGPAGLMEKLATGVRTAWSLLLVVRLLAGTRLTPLKLVHNS